MGLENARQDCCGHARHRAELLNPSPRLHRRIVVEALDRVGRGIRDLALGGHDPAVPQAHDEVRLAAAEKGFGAELAVRGQVRHVRDRSGRRLGEPGGAERIGDSAFLGLLRLVAATRLHLLRGDQCCRGHDGGRPLALGGLATLRHPGEALVVESQQDRFNDATRHVGVGVESLGGERGVGEDLQVVLADRGGGQVPNGRQLLRVRQKLDRPAAQPREINGRVDEGFDLPAVFLDIVEISLQGLMHAGLAEMTNGLSGLPLELLCGPSRSIDPHVFTAYAPSVSMSGPGTGMRSISRGSNFTSPPA